VFFPVFSADDITLLLRAACAFFPSPRFSPILNASSIRYNTVLLNFFFPRSLTRRLSLPYRNLHIVSRCISFSPRSPPFCRPSPHCLPLVDCVLPLGKSLASPLSTPANLLTAHLARCDSTRATRLGAFPSSQRFCGLRGLQYLLPTFPPRFSPLPPKN